MAGDFDPYYRWLGIPPNEQPPNHYRLLGIALYESDPEVISMAVDRQASHVRNFQAGERSRESQEILTELAAAEICLLNQEKKTAYDAELKRKLTPVKQTPAPASPGQSSTKLPPRMPPLASPWASPGNPARPATVAPARGGLPPAAVPVGHPMAPPASPMPTAMPLSHGMHLEASPLQPFINVAPPPPKRTYRNEMIVAAMLLLALAVVGWGWMQTSPEPTNTTEVADAGSPEETSVMPEETPSTDGLAGESETPVQDSSPPEPPKKSTTTTSTPSNSNQIPPLKPEPGPEIPTEVPAEPTPVDNSTPPSESPPPEAGTPNKTQPPVPAMHAPQANTEVVETRPQAPVVKPKVSVPDAATRKQAEALMYETFASDFDSAKLPSEKLLLAQKMLQRGQDLLDDAAGQYVLWDKAQSLAIEGGDPTTLLDVIAKMSEAFEIDVFEAKVKGLLALQDTVKFMEQRKRMASASMKTAQEAVANEQLDTAIKLLDTAANVAQKSGDEALVKLLADRQQEVKNLQQAYSGLSQARETLESTPNDSAANLTVGKFYSFALGNWERGMPLLAKDISSPLGALARDDQTQPTDPIAQIALADRWWELADATQDLREQARLRQRAQFWYGKALPQVSGLRQLKIEGRVRYLGFGNERDQPPLISSPYTAETLKQRQSDWMRWIKLPSASKTNSLGMKLVLVPAGEFLIGSPENEIGHQSNEGPAHSVRILRPYYIGSHEVTFAQFQQFVKATDYKTESERDTRELSSLSGREREQRMYQSSMERRAKDGVRKHGGPTAGAIQPNGPAHTWLNVGFPQMPTSPVVNVSWNDAQAFCEWLSQQEGVTYRLPTEAEWEFACRAGSSTRYAFGDDDALLDKFAWFSGNAPTGPQMVGKKQPNQLGLFDMYGNVWEWCSDFYENEYQPGMQLNPMGPAEGTERVVRGGSWWDPQSRTLPRSATRQPRPPTRGNTNIGFRVVMQIPDPAQE